MTKRLLIISLTLITSNVYASGGAGSAADLKWNIVNFVVLFGFLGWKLKKPIRNMFEKNADDVTSLYGLAEEKDKEAQIRFEEYSKKLSSLDSEKQRIMNEAEKNAETFSKEHTVETNELISNLNTEAKARIENEKIQMDRNLNATLLDEVINKVKEKMVTDKELQTKATKKLVSQI